MIQHIIFPELGGKPTKESKCILLNLKYFKNISYPTFFSEIIKLESFEKSSKYWHILGIAVIKSKAII